MNNTIPDSLHAFLQLDFIPMLTATLAAISCGLLGNFLVLRRQALMGDAISHAVLPGIVIAFLLADSLSALPILIGATIAGITCVGLIELIRKLTHLEPGAIIGVVFSIMFALGVLLLEQAGARSVDLDADCVLYGQLEDKLWLFAPTTWAGFFSAESLSDIPASTTTLMWVTLGSVLFVVLLFKELRIAAFDPQLATSLGFNASAINITLVALVAIAVVASFEAVGSILVIAMLICPAATARMLTDQMRTQVLVSVLVAAITGIGGYLLAAHAGRIFPGVDSALNAAGMMASLSGALLTTTILCAPTHGLGARALRRHALKVVVYREDVLAALFRFEELGEESKTTMSKLENRIGKRATRKGMRLAEHQREVIRQGNSVSLTESGRTHARQVVRSHRLWERYLVGEVGLRPDHVHETARRLEHLRRGGAPSRLEPEGDGGSDPHDRPIPEDY